MLFFEWRMLRRRWYAVVLGLLLTVGLVFLAILVVPVSYQAEAQLMLLPPTPAEEPKNPYIDLGGLTGVSDALARTMADPSTETTLKDQGATAEFTVESDTLAPGPIILVTTSDSSPANALSTMKAVVKLIPKHLRTMQTSEGVDSGSLITSTVLSESAKASPAIKGQLRSILVALAGGIALTWMGTAVLDAGLRRRRSGGISPAPSAAGAGGAPQQSSASLPGTTVVTDFSQIVAGRPGHHPMPPSSSAPGPAQSQPQLQPLPRISPAAPPPRQHPTPSPAFSPGRSPAQQPAPARQPASTQQPAPAQRPTPAQQPAPAQQPKPAATPETATRHPQVPDAPPTPRMLPTPIPTTSPDPAQPTAGSAPAAESAQATAPAAPARPAAPEPVPTPDASQQPGPDPEPRTAPEVPSVPNRPEPGPAATDVAEPEPSVDTAWASADENAEEPSLPWIPLPGSSHNPPLGQGDPPAPHPSGSSE